MDFNKTTIGNFELYTIHTGDFRLDGGAMFGVVPKTLWSRGIAANEKNQINMTLRCLLVRSKATGKVYLIDNGIGTKFNEKMSNIYGLDYSKRNLEQSFKQQGFSFEDVTDMVFTHLHFDHCGNTTYYDNNGQIQYKFPNAVHHVTKKHLETATNPNAREKASFLPDNINPIKNHPKLNLVDDYHEYEPGFTTIIANGHTISQQIPVIEGDGKTVVFAADLLPTHVHVPLPWVMGYDMFPTKTLLEKEEFLNNAVKNDWYIFLEHDFDTEIITIDYDGRKYSVGKKLTLNEL